MVVYQSPKLMIKVRILFEVHRLLIKIKLNMVTVLEFKEVMGNCVNAGKVTVEHNFKDINKLIQYLKDNWFDLENADKIDSIEIDLDIEGDFLLTINSLGDE